MLRAYHFTQQHCARGPFTSKAESQQGARREQLRIVLRQPRQERENREPQNRDLQRQHPAEAIRKPSCEPSAGGGHQQRRRSQHARLPARESPHCDQRGDDETIELDVHRIEGPSPDARCEHAPFTCCELA